MKFLALAFALLAFPASAAIVNASSTAAAVTAARAAKPGDVVNVTAGNGTLDLSNLQVPAPGVTLITSAKVVFDRILLSGTQGVTLRGFEVAGTPSWMSDIYAITCARITLDSLHVHSSDGTISGAGFMARDCSDVTVSNSEFEHVGLGGSIINTPRAVISGNSFHDIGEGVDLATANNAKVINNTLHDFFPDPGAHPDAIQLWDTANTGAAGNLVQGNIIYQGAGGKAQGIFAESQQNLQIIGNGMAGTMYNGISLSTTTTALIQGNFVTGYPDMGSDIIVRGGSSDVTAKDNIVSQPIVTYNGAGELPPVRFAQTGTKMIPVPAQGSVVELNVWAKGTVVTPPPPPTPDPRDALIASLQAQLAAQAKTTATLKSSLAQALVILLAAPK